MKDQITVLEVNGQEGLLLEDGKHIVGAYSHHNKLVIVLAGKTDERTFRNRVPEAFRSYDLMLRVSDCLSLQCWTDSGWLGIHAVKERFKHCIKQIL
jgi:hypothetical protein